MPVPFGFSIGDIIAVGDLAQRIIKALNETRGSTADYKSLCEVLFSLERSLQVASATFLHFSSDSSTDYSPETGPLNGIRHELGCCKRLMEEFLVCSRKYTESLLNGQGSRVKREFYKITWCLYKVEDVQKLRENIKGHLDAFNFYVSTVMRQSVARIEQKAIKISETAKIIEKNAVGISETAYRTEENTIEISEISHRLELMLKDGVSTLKALQKDMPKIIGHIWEGGCFEDQYIIHLEDALGRIIWLPLLLCDDSEKFHRLLEMLFKGRPGRRKVTEREYEVMDTSEGAPIEPFEWEHKVIPGMRIAMSVVIKTIIGSAKELGSTAHHCPRCHAPNCGAIPEKGLLKCRHCTLLFRTTHQERIVELSDDSAGQKPTTGTKKRAAPEDEPGEEYVFKRIHYLREVVKHQATTPKGTGREDAKLVNSKPKVLPDKRRSGRGARRQAVRVRSRQGESVRSRHNESVRSKQGGSVLSGGTPSWYCQSCGFGPHKPFIDIGCANCGSIAKPYR